MLTWNSERCRLSNTVYAEVVMIGVMTILGHPPQTQWTVSGHIAANLDVTESLTYSAKTQLLYALRIKENRKLPVS